MSQYNQNDDYIYSQDNNGESRPDMALENMRSTMHKRDTTSVDVSLLEEELSVATKQVSNLVRENRTLRIKTTNTQNELRNMQSVITELGRELELYKNVLIEYSKRLDHIEDNAIIKRK